MLFLFHIFVTGLWSILARLNVALGSEQYILQQPDSSDAPTLASGPYFLFRKDAKEFGHTAYQTITLGRYQHCLHNGQ